MFYKAITFTLSPFSEETADIIAALLAEHDYDSFSYTSEGVIAYIPEEQFREEVLNQLAELPLFADQALSWNIDTIENRDWNKIWEENFTPIRVQNKILVRASFHPADPEVEYEIIIDPKMSFGTGHHATTALMLETILNHTKQFKGKQVLDMGCGTGILSIMASKAGAAAVTGIDIDDWAYHNARENLATNRITNVNIQIGDARLLDGSSRFDLILANINRNILLEDMPAYVKVLNSNGWLIMSGFYTEDLPLIRERAESLELSFHSLLERDNWVAVIFNK